MLVKMFRKYLLALVSILLLNSPLMAQEVEMAERFRGEGKIYVVVGVMLVLLIGLFAYLWRIDRNVKKLEEK